MADCCIASFDVDEEALDQNLKQDLGGGLVIYKSGQRGILFKVVMGNAEDVPEVAVIQYYKNAQLADGQGHTVTIPPGPRDQRWKWSAGADGFIVDRASGDQRCWPEYNAQNAKRGLQRDQATKTGKWEDNPGISLAGIAALFQANPALVFPLTYTIDFKTDVLCAEAKICSAEKDVTAEQRARWSSAVRATVSWSFKCVYITAPSSTGGQLPAVSWNDPPRVLGIQKRVLKPC